MQGDELAAAVGYASHASLYGRDNARAFVDSDAGLATRQVILRRLIDERRCERVSREVAERIGGGV
jgi:hypothetical protein